MAVSARAYPVRVPAWQVVYTGVNITTDISRMVIEVSYKDGHAHTHGRGRHRTAEADEIEVILEDRDRRWQQPWFPGRGDGINLQIGYANEAMLSCGNFQVDELELRGPPDTFHLKCIATGITPSIRSPHSAAYEGKTLSQIAQVVAQAHTLTVTGAPQNINVSWQRISQRQETDLAFLRRLALQHGYDFNIRGNQIIFYSLAALEQADSVTLIQRTQVKDFEFKTKTQAIYKSATVTYQQPATKQLITATAQDSSAPTGDDLHIVARCETPQQAQLKAQSALHDANMLQGTAQLSMEGNILLVAGINIDVQGFGAFDGKWHVESSKHQLERQSGYTTEVELRQLSTG